MNERIQQYEYISSAIRFLEEHRHEQPGLDAVAAALGLSVPHFQRIFSAWVGATPEDFLPCLTLSHARELLRTGENQLSSCLDSGISGSGRLNALRVTLEAATPEEIKACGAGLSISAGFATSPFGNCLLGETPRGICHLSFFDGNDDAALAELKSTWPLADTTTDDERAQEMADKIFSPVPPSSPWKLHVRGTPFQLRVWCALLDIAPGTLVSYGKLAAFTGHPKASRAIGTAVGSNAISYLIPCHRVIRETASSGNYRWGAIRKRAILAWECSQSPVHDATVRVVGRSIPRG